MDAMFTRYRGRYRYKGRFINEKEYNARMRMMKLGKKFLSYEMVKEEIKVCSFLS